MPWAVGSARGDAHFAAEEGKSCKYVCCFTFLLLSSSFTSFLSFFPLFFPLSLFLLPSSCQSRAPLLALATPFSVSPTAGFSWWCSPQRSPSSSELPQWWRDWRIYSGCLRVSHDAPPSVPFCSLETQFLFLYNSWPDCVTHVRTYYTVVEFKNNVLVKMSFNLELKRNYFLWFNWSNASVVNLWIIKLAVIIFRLRTANLHFAATQRFSLSPSSHQNLVLTHFTLNFALYCWVAFITWS